MVMTKFYVKPMNKSKLGDGRTCIQLPFPLDMLRYDSCYPANQESVGRIAYTLDNIRLEEHETIELLTGYRTTPERWESFGWEITKEVRRI